MGTRMMMTAASNRLREATGIWKEPREMSITSPCRTQLLLIYNKNKKINHITSTKFTSVLLETEKLFFVILIQSLKTIKLLVHFIGISLFRLDLLQLWERRILSFFFTYTTSILEYCFVPKCDICFNVFLKRNFVLCIVPLYLKCATVCHFINVVHRFYHISSRDSYYFLFGYTLNFIVQS